MGQLAGDFGAYRKNTLKNGKKQRKKGFNNR